MHYIFLDAQVQYSLKDILMPYREVRSGSRTMTFMFISYLCTSGRVCQAIYLVPMCLSLYIHKPGITAMIICHMVVVGVNKFTNVSTQNLFAW